MNNIFENAYFGKSYRTRDERRAIYLWSNKKEGHSLIIDGEKKPHHYNEQGKWYSYENEKPLDIISEWQEEINEEELDKLADSNNIYDRFADDFECENYYGFIEGFKVGYRKAKEM